MRDTVVSLARSWIGTPYVHQASLRGHGTDCLGLLRGLWRTIYGDEPETIAPYTQDWSEAGPSERLREGLARHMVERPTAEMSLGDVLLFRMRDGAMAKHLGILTFQGEAVKFLHAYVGHGVVENTLSDPWKRRIAACFSFPERGDT